MQLQTGIVFDGNPDEIVYASPQTIYDVIPNEAVDWKRVFEQLYGHSQPGKFWRKGDLFDYVLNVYARFFLPQYTYVGNTIYEAAHYFFLADDLKPDNKLQGDDVLGFWTVTAQALQGKEATSEADPCFQRYQTETGTYSYFGYTPHPHKAVPYPGPCKQQFEINETAQGGPNYNPANNNGFRWTFADGGSSTYHKAGGWSAELMTIEVTEGGLLYVSLPELPDGVNFPPPLVGRVVDFGPPGPPGRDGVQGPPGQDGADGTPLDFVSGACGLNPSQLNQTRQCLGIPDIPSYPALVFAATPLEVQEAQQILIEKAPDVMVPSGEVVLTESGAATMEATALSTGRIHWILTLPIALLLGLKMLLTTIKVATCLNRITPYIKEMPFPVLGFQEVSQAAVFQEIFDQFAMLQQCCKPCELDAWEFIDGVTGPYSNYLLRDYDAILLKFKDPAGPEINQWYRSGTIFKYGEFRWAYEDHIDIHFSTWNPRLGALEFWNSEEQIFEAPNALTIGFTLDMEYLKHYDVWARPKQRLPSDTPLP